MCIYGLSLVETCRSTHLLKTSDQATKRCHIYTYIYIYIYIHLKIYLAIYLYTDYLSPRPADYLSPRPADQRTHRKHRTRLRRGAIHMSIAIYICIAFSLSSFRYVHIYLYSVPCRDLHMNAPAENIGSGYEEVPYLYIYIYMYTSIYI